VPSLLSSLSFEGVFSVLQRIQINFHKAESDWLSDWSDWSWDWMGMRSEGMGKKENEKKTATLWNLEDSTLDTVLVLSRNHRRSCWCCERFSPLFYAYAKRPNVVEAAFFQQATNAPDCLPKKKIEQRTNERETKDRREESEKTRYDTYCFTLALSAHSLPTFFITYNAIYVSIFKSLSYFHLSY
jgi:hypothetical protein